MIDLVLNTLIPEDIDLKMPAASSIDFESYKIKHKIDLMVDNFIYLLNQVAIDIFDAPFTAISDEQRLAAVNYLKLKNIRLFSEFLTHCFRAYYSDVKVLAKLSVGSIPSFPSGNYLESDDWTILESVYDRGIAYRQIF